MQMKMPRGTPKYENTIQLSYLEKRMGSAGTQATDCGMPLKDANISWKPDGVLHEKYGKHCYINGKFVSTGVDAFINTSF